MIMMAKKKKDESDQHTLTGRADSDQPTPAANKHYTTGTWASYEQFRCKHCEFDTLELDVMVEHLFWMHSILLDDPKENQ
jgi:hypothetical protein